MAEDPKAKDKGAAPAAEAAPAAPPKKLLGGKNLIILIVMLVLLGGGTGFWIHHAKQKHAAEEGEGGVAAAPEEQSSIEAFDSMVVNVMGTQGTRYLKVAVSVELSSTSLKEYAEEFNDRKVQLMDRLNAVLSSKSLDQLDSPAQRDDIKRQLRDELQGVLKKPGSIKNVYFTDFVVQ